MVATAATEPEVAPSVVLAIVATTVPAVTASDPSEAATAVTAVAIPKAVERISPMVKLTVSPFLWPI